MSKSRDLKTFRNTDSKLIKFVSTQPIDDSEENIRKIEKFLKKENYGNVKVEKISTPGMSGYCFIGNYRDKNRTRGVFIDISREKEDMGKVYITASKEQIEKLMGISKIIPGIEFEELK